MTAASFENDGLSFQVIDEGPGTASRWCSSTASRQDPTSYDKVVPALHAAGLRTLATPHPAAMSWSYTHTTQALTSWHMVAFTVPVVPEQTISRAYVPIFTGAGMQLEDALAARERLGRGGDPDHRPRPGLSLRRPGPRGGWDR